MLNIENLNLMRHALASEGIKTAYLIPVPSSIASDNPLFSTKARQKGISGCRNRDNRNSVFCNLLSIADGTFKTTDVLIRVNSKPEKATWSAGQHATSMKLRAFGTAISGEEAIILVDDVTTDGGTLMGARTVFANAYPQAVIICLAIGSTKAPQQFLPLV